MASINKQNLIDQIETAIAGLTVGTETTENLLFFLKTAMNAGTSASSIMTELQTRINAIDITDELKEVVLLTVATYLMTKDRAVTVSDLATLQGFSSDISVGSIYYVESEGAPYIKKTNGTWVLIDPNIQPLATINGWAWGSNSTGRLGDNTTTNRSSPVSIVNISDWVQLSAGGNSFGIRNDGTLWGWGWNNSGRIGDGTTVDRISPVLVLGGFTDWSQVEAGSDHVMALRANGTLWGWGVFGLTGDGTSDNRSSPVSVVGGFTDWIQVSASSGHNLALRANGSAWSWGGSFRGQLGDGTATSKSSPVSVVGGYTDWIQLSAGDSHSIGLRTNGTIWSWGYNLRGRLGDGTTVNKSSPVSVVGGYTDWVQISGGLTHSLGLRANGTIWAWGDNSSVSGSFTNALGQLGDGTTIDKSSPVSVIGGFTDWSQISAGHFKSFAIRANGTMWSWGNNNSQGQLGDGTTISKSSPVSVVGGFNDWVQVSSGNSHTLGVRIA